MKYRSIIVRSVLFCSSFAILLYIQNLYYLLYKANKKIGNQLDHSQILTSSISTKLLVVTRVHMKSANTMPDPMKVINFIENCQTYANMILICVGSDSYLFIETYIASVKNILKERNQLIIPMDNILFLPIIPWGYFTTSLNAAILQAQEYHYNYIAFQVRYQYPL